MIGERHDSAGLPKRRAKQPGVATSRKCPGKRSYLRTGGTSSEVMPTAMTITESTSSKKKGGDGVDPRATTAQRPHERSMHIPCHNALRHRGRAHPDFF